ncbi:hypothetical protein I302_104848 [Kwoniella bestiolae CBS 10118]|uniref:MADS-box domain-containing protein n=1 Tax=Kwoniella bestiolae CBS 10118 TaxID=1296100 RepID=A0A1B9FRK4_9TREE|nr:hypothetical protein I302_09083 [Kwoniella bestiolae CBS 10118]OCF21405.1 hypothetical protein I302_09083 [Kwoniella bestiolae CBS 10118]
MGRKKIEIRPLTDERNRNVTFLKRKAGLMKKAWELSVLCGADVNIIIFNAAGKAYEFSSKELDEEIDRYMDYEGMIERRRAPEFAAMALAGEDDEDEDEDDPPARRGSTSKSGAGANANAIGAAPRSLKGKESFKARTPRYSEKGKSSKSSKHKSKRRKERSESEKRSFIDSILSQSESGSEDDEEEDSSDMRKRRKEKERSRDRRDRRGTGGYVRDERYIQSDKNAAALQYAMNMHSSHSHGHGHGQQIHDSRFYQQQQHVPSHSQLHGRDRYHEEGGNSQIPVDIPQLPKLPSDGTSYRLSTTSGLGSTSQLSQSQSAFYGPSSSSSSSNQYVPNLFQHQTQNYLPPSSESVLPSQYSTAQNPQSMVSVPGPGGIQWNESLIAKYAEFQLQQNHQKQQRLLLERQRHQLQQMGVPVDERSLLDEIFGGNLAQAQQNQNQNVGESYGGGGMILPLNDTTPTEGGGDFIWPLSNNGRPQSSHPEDQSSQFMVPTQQGRNVIPDESVQWGVQDGYTVDRDDLNLPSPVSNGNGNGNEGKRKMMVMNAREDDGKRMRI